MRALAVGYCMVISVAKSKQKNFFSDLVLLFVLSLVDIFCVDEEFLAKINIVNKIIYVFFILG
jgi:hypothetical protein